MTQRSATTTTLLSVFLAFVAWFLLAPTQLGGRVTYVIVDGNSMESKFHLGDLVLVRKTSPYQIGDAVTYENAEMGTFVFHRIVQFNLDRFILKGDNNEWMDTYQPTQAEIVGKLWVHIPKLGKAIEWLRIPANLAIAVGLLGGSFMYSMIQPSKKEKRGVKQPSRQSGNPVIALYVVGSLVLLFLGLAVYAFIQPISTSMGMSSYRQEGSFFYSAAGTPGIYDTDKVRSGEPIFPKLTCYLNIGYSYSLTAEQLQDVSGKQQLLARVIDEKSGWQRTLPMTSENVFSGNSFMTMSTLDLCQVQALVEMVEKETGLRENTYTLDIVANTAVTARLAGDKVNDSFEPVLKLKFDDVHFYLAENSGQEDPLYSSKEGVVQGTTLQPNTLSVLGLQPFVRSVRVFSMMGLLVSLLTLTGIGWFTFRGTRDHPDALIRMKYSGLLVDVHEYALESYSPLVDVNTIDDLARLAERQNTMILHIVDRFADYYLVRTHGFTYRYIATNENANVAAIAALPHQARNSIDRISAAADNDYLQIGLFGQEIRTGARSISNADPTRKIILRYTINTNSDINPGLESDGELFCDKPIPN